MPPRLRFANERNLLASGKVTLPNWPLRLPRPRQDIDNQTKRDAWLKVQWTSRPRCQRGSNIKVTVYVSMPRSPAICQLPYSLAVSQSRNSK